MPSLALQRDSSPDPLGMSQNASSPLKARTRQTPPRKALSSTTSNIQTHDIRITTPGPANSRSSSPVRSTETKENQYSPWQIRVTVQAEQNPQQVGSSVPQCSPSKHFAERTFTTTVPLRGEDETSPVRRKNKTTPRKSRNSSAKRASASKSPTTNSSQKAQKDPLVDTGASKPLQSPKRGRGRPRKSVDSSVFLSSAQDSHQKSAGQPPTPSNMDPRQKTPCTSSGRRTSDADGTEREAVDTEDQFGEFDSVMESEGFSMVSVSSLPSAQGSSGVVPGSEYSLGRSLRSSSKKNITPSDFDHSPLPPPAPKVGAAPQCTRELNKTTSGTPKLARVVRAGIALQGVLSPARQRYNQANLAPWLNHSSPMSSTSSPKERLDKLFNGFGPGTCRELRAGLRLGEELAKRMSPDFRRSDQQANEDVFAPNSEVQYPELPATEKYSLKIPDAAMVKSVPFSNNQLPSPSASEATEDNDTMSWKFDTLQSNALKADLGKVTSTEANDSTNQSMMKREAQYQRERDAISKQIDEANPSQVNVIDSDEEAEGSVEDTYEDDGDIWQEEARVHDKRPSTSDVPPIFLQNEPRKPRRSQIPSPWMRKTQDIQSSSPAPNDSDLFWQPSQAGTASKNIGNPKQDIPEYSRSSAFMSSKSSISALSADGVEDDVGSPSTLKNTSALGTSLPSPTSEEEDQHDHNPSRHQEQTILNQSLESSDSEDSTYEAEDSDEFLSDIEDIDSTLLGHDFLQDSTTNLLDDESTEAETPSVETPTSSKTAISESVPEPRTPSCLARTPRATISSKT
ncbi:MAG: hypothetical protein Q9168_007716, partial [Polycauliona sp. 1 TL-2023]